ncbi:hypothetical protein CBR_g30124 [Chara braunii]|uniref:peptidyl-tRNA hydrolase n=1 Tax=Chara braunii TaxID=69332 RepID=A0A388LC25_CHABU|nr:hypothetical protein CBR_g30124 [Chara braunii]|eukprot:GBG79859.1 hypothetical protein CBR_g30124 [Chara braunii]
MYFPLLDARIPSEVAHTLTQADIRWFHMDLIRERNMQELEQIKVLPGISGLVLLNANEKPMGEFSQWWEGPQVWAPAQGTRGKVGIMLHKDLQAQIIDSEANIWGRWAWLKAVIGKEEWVFMTVYAPTEAGEKGKFFARLMLHVPKADRRLLAGDWNVSLNEALRSGAPTTNRNDVRTVLEFIAELTLVDPFPILNPDDPGYTRTSHLQRDRQTVTRRRLDYFLLSEQVMDRVTSVRHAFHPISDHKSVMVDLRPNLGCERGRGFFRLNNQVLRVPGVGEWVTDHMTRWEGTRHLLSSTAEWLDGNLAITSGVLDVILRIITRTRNKREADCKKRVEEVEERMEGRPISLMVWAAERERRLAEWDNIQEEKQKRWTKGKSPGVDGLSVEFYAVNWGVLGSLLVELYNEVLVGGKLGKGMTHGVITVLFKKGDKAEVRNWRPISLLNVSYKILAKSLARRLSKCLLELVEKNQGAFVQGRSIFNNIMTAIESLEVIQEENRDMAVLLLDLEKAYNKSGAVSEQRWEQSREQRVTGEKRAMASGVAAMARLSQVVYLFGPIHGGGGGCVGMRGALRSAKSLHVSNLFTLPRVTGGSDLQLDWLDSCSGKVEVSASVFSSSSSSSSSSFSSSPSSSLSSPSASSSCSWSSWSCCSSSPRVKGRRRYSCAAVSEERERDGGEGGMSAPVEGEGRTRRSSRKRREGREEAPTVLERTLTEGDKEEEEEEERGRERGVNQRSEANGRSRLIRGRSRPPRGSSPSTSTSATSSSVSSQSTGEAEAAATATAAAAAAVGGEGERERGGGDGGKQGLWLIVGLGNPGRKYAGTRHNAGFEVIDRLAMAEGIRMGSIESKAVVGRGLICNIPVLLAKPQTFMNRSGQAVGPLAAYYRIPNQRVLVICDDLDLSLASLRIRRKGSAAGHNGMTSVIEGLKGSKDFPRLRIGIGRPRGGIPVEAYVLQKFTQEEREEMDCTLHEATNAVRAVLVEGIDKAMSLWNVARSFRLVGE